MKFHFHETKSKEKLQLTMFQDQFKQVVPEAQSMNEDAFKKALDKLEGHCYKYLH